MFRVATGKIVLTIALTVMLSFIGGQIHARGLKQSLRCDDAINVAAREHQVPIQLMRAIARAESGRTVAGQFTSWPWTINAGGEGEWLATADDAISLFQRHLNSGKQNIDIGCFQINFRWHGHNFRSIHDMFDPMTNARYAARFLKDLYREFGDWTTAAGAFHSRTQAHSVPYIKRLHDILSAEGFSDGLAPSRLTSENRTNAFPLLTGTSRSTARGSLFPLQHRSRGSLLLPVDGRG